MPGFHATLGCVLADYKFMQCSSLIEEINRSTLHDLGDRQSGRGGRASEMARSDSATANLNNAREPTPRYSAVAISVAREGGLPGQATGPRAKPRERSVEHMLNITVIIPAGGYQAHLR